MKAQIMILSLTSILTVGTTAAHALEKSSPHSQSISDSDQVVPAITQISDSTYTGICDILYSENTGGKQPTINLDLDVNYTKSSVKNTSGASEVALAKHLKKIGAKMYGAFWCPYCTKQKELFGKQAFASITYIECDPRGTNPHPDLCRKAGVRGYPQWVIKGRTYTGLQSLNDLANFSGYRGSRNFKY